MMRRTLFLSLLTSLLFTFSFHSNAQDCLNLQLATANVAPGDQVCLPVTVSNFDNIVGFQFSVNWDGDNLTYANLIEFNPDLGISINNFGTPAGGLAEGTLTVSWTSPSLTPVSIGDNETLFSICLDVIGDESLVTFSESPTPFEFLNENLEELPAGFLNGKASTIEPIDLIQVDEICADILTCTNPSTTLSATIFGGTLPYTYLWEGPNGYFASDQSPVVNQMGLYKLFVTDDNGYVASALYNVRENIEDDFISSVTITNATCPAGDDGAITIEVDGNLDDFAFVWSNGENTNSIQNLSPGDYSVTILDWISACVVEESYTIAEDGFLTAFSYECEFLPDTIMATITSIVWTGGTTPYTFAWSTGDTTITAAGISSIYVGANETYSLTITDVNGCEEIYTDIVADCQGETPLGVDVTYECMEDQGAIQVELIATPTTGNAPYTFEWSDGSMTTANGADTIVVNYPGSYGVTVTDADGLVYEDSNIDVDCSALEDFVTATSYSCLIFEDSTVVELSLVVWAGGTQPYTFEWSNGFTEVDSFITTNIYTCPGTFDVTITDANGVSDVLYDLTDDCNCGGSSNEVALNISSADVEVGDQFCVDVSVDNFNEVIGIQGTIEWDETLMSFDDVNDFGLLSSLAFGTNGLPDNGKMTYSWVDPDLSGESFADGTVLFELCFTAIANGSSIVTPVNDPAIIEFIDVNSELLPFTTNPGVVQIGDPNELIVGIAYECIDYVDSLDIHITAVSWNGTPPFTFEWSTGTTEVSNFQSVETVHDDAATYGLTVTDAQGLTYVNDNIQPICGSTQPEFVTASSCETTYYEDSTVVDLTMVVWGGGTPPYTFEWSNGFIESNSLSSTLTYTCPGTYSLTITDNDGYSEIFENITDACDCSPIDYGDVQLSIDNGVGETGDQVCLSVRAEAFDDVMAFQYTMVYDEDLVELSTIEPKDLPGLDITAFGFPTPGVVTVSWIDATLSGVTLSQGTALYELCFDITGPIGSIAGVSFGNIPTPIEFVNSNSEVVSFTGTNGSITIAENVWPGDADNNELVTNVDLLNVGLGYGQMGPARPDTGTDWQGYGAYDWTGSTPNSNVNYKNADANGDGMISALDANAILDNYGEETNLWNGNEDQFNSSPQNNLMSPPIFVLPDTVIPGAIVEFPIIMGSEDFPASDIYGIAFTILYDPEVVVPESAFASFGTSWVGMLDDNMLGLYKDFHDNGKIDIAITRTDGMNVSGNGQIGSLHLTIEDVILRTTLYPVEFEVVDIKVIRNDEELIEITPKQTTMVIDVVNDIYEIPLEEEVQVYPNPTNDHLFINANSVNIQQLSIYSVDGRMMPIDYERTNELSLKNLPNGVYLLKVLTDRGMVNKRIVKQGH